MLKELLTYIAASCPAYARQMGYLYETIATRERYRRNSNAWNPHLENSRDFILSVTEKTAKRNKAVITGSGLLLDVPLRELSCLFNEVILLDIIHLPETIKGIKKYHNVKIEWHDVTGIAKKIHDFSEKTMALPEPSPSLPAGYDDADLVVSLNILSQLPVIPCIFALKKMHRIKDFEPETWGRQIIESHISFLNSLKASVCLISDYNFALSDKKGVIAEQGSTIYNVQVPEPEKKWTWKISPYGEGEKGFSKNLDVGAWSQIR